MVRTKPIGKEVSHEFVAKLSKTISRGYSCQLVGTNDCNILNGRGILHKKKLFDSDQEYQAFYISDMWPEMLKQKSILAILKSTMIILTTVRNILSKQLRSKANFSLPHPEHPE